MYVQHTPDIWQQFAQLVAGALVVEGIHTQVNVALHLQPWYQRAREKLGEATESALPEVAAWRRAYTQMGLKPTQYRSAAEALLRRFRRGDTIPHLHPLVDLCNAVSLAFALPVAVFDLEHVEGFLEVRHATGTEHHLAFSGEIEQPEQGEVIFADAAQHAHARRWTFRQSKQSTVRNTTQRVLIVCEGLHATAGEDVPLLIDALAEQLGSLWAPPQQRAILSAASPRLTWE
jgi:DNA/RNA-binding domain of Phe-tRNA-synthetase-like protein